MPENEQEINYRITSLETTMKSSMSELTDAVKTLVALEIEHKATRETLARYGEKLEKHDSRLDAIEQTTPRIARFLDRWDKVTLTITIAVVLAATGTILGITYG